MAIRLLLDELVIILIMFYISLSTSQRIGGETYKEPRDNAPDLNDFLLTVLQHKEDFKKIREANRIFEECRLRQPNSKLFSPVSFNRPINHVFPSMYVNENENEPEWKQKQKRNLLKGDGENAHSSRYRRQAESSPDREISPNLLNALNLISQIDFNDNTKLNPRHVSRDNWLNTWKRGLNLSNANAYHESQCAANSTSNSHANNADKVVDNLPLIVNVDNTSLTITKEKKFDQPHRNDEDLLDFQKEVMGNQHFNKRKLLAINHNEHVKLRKLQYFDLGHIFDYDNTGNQWEDFRDVIHPAVDEKNLHWKTPNENDDFLRKEVDKKDAKEDGDAPFLRFRYKMEDDGEGEDDINGKKFTYMKKKFEHPLNDNCNLNVVQSIPDANNGFKVNLIANNEKLSQSKKLKTPVSIPKYDHDESVSIKSSHFDMDSPNRNGAPQPVQNDRKYRNKAKTILNTVDSFKDIVEPKQIMRKVENKHKRDVDKENEIEHHVIEKVQKNRQNLKVTHNNGQKANQRPFHKQTKNRQKQCKNSLENLSRCIRDTRNVTAEDSAANNTQEEIADDSNDELMSEFGEMKNAVSGTLALDIVTNVVKLVKDSSHLRETFSDSIIIKHKSNDLALESPAVTDKSTINSSETILNHLMEVIDKIIVDQVRTRTCHKLSVYQKAYLKTITGAAPPMNLDMLNPGVLDHNREPTANVSMVNQGTYLFKEQQRKPTELTDFDVGKKKEVIQELIAKYDKLSKSGQVKVEPVQKFLQEHLRMLQEMTKDANDTTAPCGFIDRSHKPTHSPPVVLNKQKQANSASKSPTKDSHPQPETVNLDFKGVKPGANKDRFIQNVGLNDNAHEAVPVQQKHQKETATSGTRTNEGICEQDRLVRGDHGANWKRKRKQISDKYKQLSETMERLRRA